MGSVPDPKTGRTFRDSVLGTKDTKLRRFFSLHRTFGTKIYDMIIVDISKDSMGRIE